MSRKVLTISYVFSMKLKNQDLRNFKKLLKNYLISLDEHDKK